MSAGNAAALDLAALPTLSLSERKQLPETAAIYFVLAGNVVLYVGRAINLRQRWAAHHRLAQLNERGGCRIAWLMVNDVSLLNELEQACISHFTPILNSREYPHEDDKITVIFPTEVGRQMREVAAREATPVSILIRRWVVERLDQAAKERASER